MDECADMRALDVWYWGVDIEAVMEDVHDKDTRARMRKRIKKAGAQTVTEHDFPKLTETKGNRCVIKENKPLIYHHPHINLAASRHNIRPAFTGYHETLEDARNALLDPYESVDQTRKTGRAGRGGTVYAHGR